MKIITYFFKIIDKKKRCKRVILDLKKSQKSLLSVLTMKDKKNIKEKRKLGFLIDI